MSVGKKSAASLNILRSVSYLVENEDPEEAVLVVLKYQKNFINDQISRCGKNMYLIWDNSFNSL